MYIPSYLDKLLSIAQLLYCAFSKIQQREFMHPFNTKSLFCFQYASNDLEL
ncbi:hypothetical protein RchiOBHm_Chr2g0160571 [Rosa chinensis]|uniref:Uncharacterized protein n=1 Tax=Rosa chinensis TaxID=74649 RepID=A0A2P6S2J5_ROSCH|nr:hypothetical protein RchiOBHm_Chr2g0160571 [Rosa chinensis]